jgi:hypothetical protein
MTAESVVRLITSIIPIWQMYRGPRRYPAPAFQQRGIQPYARSYGDAESAVKSQVPVHPFLVNLNCNSGIYNEVERHLVDLCSRFPNRQINQDLTHMICHYATSPPSAIPLNVAVDFNLKSPDNCVKTEQSGQKDGPMTKHVVNVMLLNGASKDEDKSKTKVHLSKRLKFLFMRKELPSGALVPIRGEWSTEDGKTPSDESLIKTAIRCAREVAGLDVSKCTSWIKMIELWLKHEDGGSTHVVFFLPDIWVAYADGLHPCTQVREDSQEVTEEVEEEVDGEDDKSKKKIMKKVTTIKKVQIVLMRPTEVHLSSLLETDASSEEMLEVALFADCFDEMLQRDFSIQLQSFLQKKKADVEAEQAEEKKRKRMTEEEAEKSKRQKTEADSTIKQTASDAKDCQPKASEQKTEDASKDENKPRMKIVHNVNQQILAPFQYFDRQNIDCVSGNIKREVIEGLLYRLGDMSKNQVDELLNVVGLHKTAKPSPILYYIKLATTTTEVIEEEAAAVVVAAVDTNVEVKDATPEIAVDNAESKSTPTKDEMTAENLNKLLLRDLKELAVKRGLSTEGKKSDLVSRLLQPE